MRVTVKDSATAPVVAWQDYYAFGKVSRNSYEAASRPKENFTGHVFDEESSMIYARARYYNPEIGRWNSLDPLHQYASGYVYCANNPIAIIDPTGKFGETSDEAKDMFLYGWVGYAGNGGKSKSKSSYSGPSFQSLWNEYPKSKMDEPKFHPVPDDSPLMKWVGENQCGLRMSLALILVGVDLAPYATETVNAKGEVERNYVKLSELGYNSEGILLFRTDDIAKILTDLYGSPKEFKGNESFRDSKYYDTNGAIYYKPTGRDEDSAKHIDLWNGKSGDVANDRTGSGGHYKESPLIIFWEIK